MTQATNPHGERLIWNLTERAIVGLASVGIMLAISVGSWSLKMQMDSKIEIRDLKNTIEVLVSQVQLQDQRDASERNRLEQRIVALEQWGPAYGPRFTSKDLDSRMETVMGTYAKLYDRLVANIERQGETINKQAELIARFDERIKRMEAKP